MTIGEQVLKKKHDYFIYLTLLFLLILQTVTAQDVTKTNLPEGAKLRIGRGTLGEIAYFPDGTRFAVATSIGIWVYDSITGEELYQLTNHTNGINCIRFSPNGETFATTTLEGSVLLWNTRTGQLLTTIMDEFYHYEPVFSPKGDILASSSDTKFESANITVKLWDVKTGEHLKTFAETNSRFFYKCFSPDGKLLATRKNRDTVMQLWDVDTGEFLKTITDHEKCDFKAYFSPDGNTIASYCNDKTVRLWDVNTGEHLDTLVQKDTDDFSSISFSPDGTILATGGITNGNVDLWDAGNAKHLKTLTGHKGSVTNICFSSNGNIIASGGSDGSIRLWSTNLRLHLKTLIGHKNGIDTLLFSPDGITLLSKGMDNTVRLWDVITGENIKTLDGYIENVVSVSYSPDGKTIASANSDNIVRLWNANTGQLVNTLTGHTGEIYRVCFSPDGKTIASCSSDKSIRLWDTETLIQLKSLTIENPFIKRLYFISDGKILASCSWKGKIHLWDIRTGHRLKTVSGELISPDGNIVLSVYHEEVDDGDGSGISFLHISDVDTGQLHRKITYEGIISIKCFSPDGKTYAISDRKNSNVEIWDVHLGKLLNSFSGHLMSHPDCGGDSITTVRYSPSAKIIASGSHDTTVRLWNTDKGQHIKTLSGHTRSINSVAFSPDGKTLASGSGDGIIFLWDVPQ